MELIDEFLKFETEHNLLEDRIEEFYYWIYMRFDLFMEIQQKAKGVAPLSARPNKKTKLKKLKRYAKTAWNAISRSPIHNAHGCELIFINHERRMMLDRKYRPIYFEGLANAINKSFMIIEPRNVNNEYYSPISFDKQTYYFDELVSFRCRLAVYRANYRNEAFEKRFTNTIAELNLKLGIAVDAAEWINRIYRAKAVYECQRDYFTVMLKKIKPKKIVEVVYYNNMVMALNEAARMLNIPTYELQHGTMGYYHIAYNFFEKKALPMLPDKILLFSEYWRSCTRLPLNNENIIVTGYPHMEKMSDKYMTDDKPHRTNILFVSQKTIGRHLSKFAVELANELDRRNEEYKIYYKLHPAECPSWNEDLPELYEQRNKIEVIADSARLIYEYFAVCNIQIGVYSTALFEGLAFDMDTYIFNAPGSENMSALWEGGYASLIANTDDFFKERKNIKKHGEFWQRNSVSRIVQALNL